MLRRRLFTLASLLSLLLCAATVVLWVRSHFIADQRMAVDYRFANGRGYRDSVLVHSLMGELIVTSIEAWSDDSKTAQGFRTHKRIRSLRHSKTPESDWKNEISYTADHMTLGFAYLQDPGWTTSPGSKLTLRGKTLAIPYYAVTFPFVLLPSLWLVGLLRRRRQRRVGRCPKCRYDLTANVSGICPECGTAVPAKAGA